MIAPIQQPQSLHQLFMLSMRLYTQSLYHLMPFALVTALVLSIPLIMQSAGVMSPFWLIVIVLLCQILKTMFTLVMQTATWSWLKSGKLDWDKSFKRIKSKAIPIMFCYGLLYLAAPLWMQMGQWVYTKVNSGIIALGWVIASFILIWFGIRLTFVFTTMVIDETDLVASFARGWLLTRNQVSKIMFMMLFPITVAIFLSVLSLAVEQTYHGDIMGWVIQIVLWAMEMPLVNAFMITIYQDLRLRRKA